MQTTMQAWSEAGTEYSQHQRQRYNKQNKFMGLRTCMLAKVLPELQQI